MSIVPVARSSSAFSSSGVKVTYCPCDPQQHTYGALCAPAYFDSVAIRSAIRSERAAMVRKGFEPRELGMMEPSAM